MFEIKISFHESGDLLKVIVDLRLYHFLERAYVYKEVDTPFWKKPELVRHEKDQVGLFEFLFHLQKTVKFPELEDFSIRELI